MQRSRSAPQKSLVGFVVGEVRYAVDITQVREIINPVELTVLPHTPVEIAGVADHRDEVVPVLNLRARFGLPEVEPTRATKWILVRVHGDRTIGLIVDRVTEVFGATSVELGTSPEVGPGSGARAIGGMVRHNDGLVFVLDIGRFVDLEQELRAEGALLP